MILVVLRWTVLFAALAPLAYYAIASYCGWSYFRALRKAPAIPAPFTPPVSILKPVRGLDNAAYENFASFCRLDYPQYELLFGVAEAGDPAIPVVQRLQRDFPECAIRLLVGAPLLGTSPKMNNLCRLVQEAQYRHLVINDSDVRVESDYLQNAVSPLRDPKVGVVTAFFRGFTEGNLASDLDAIGVPGDSSASVLVAQKFGRIDFALGWTMATTKERLAEIGGFEAMANHHSDDFTLGNKIAARGYRIELMRKPVWMVFPRQSLLQFLRHELRWSIMLRNIRPIGYLGLATTFGLPWTALAVFAAHSTMVSAAYLAAYLILRLTMAWIIGVWGLGDSVLRRRIWMVPLRDAASFLVWAAGFFCTRVSWRGKQYQVKESCLVPLTNPTNAPNEALAVPASATLISARR